MNDSRAQPKTTLFIAVKNPFSQRDFDRMGIAELASVFDVRVLDCTAWLMPTALGAGDRSVTAANVTLVTSLRALWVALGSAHAAVALDYVGTFSIRSLMLFWALRHKRVKLAIMDSGNVPYPGHQELLRNRIATWIFATQRLGLLWLFRKITVRLLTKLLGRQQADVAFVSGAYSLRDPRVRSARMIVETHSFDYERYRKIAGQPRVLSYEYAVYLDEKIMRHEDDKILRQPSAASAEAFLPAIEHFFDQFSREATLPVVVAAYPTLSGESSAQWWPGRTVLHGQTAELIRDAALVFVHASTAVSFAVLSDRPLVHLTSREIESSWYQAWIDAMRLHDGGPMHNIDHTFPDSSVLKTWFDIDRDRYRAYEATFLRHSHSTIEPLWSTVARILRSLDEPQKNSIESRATFHNE